MNGPTGFNVRFKPNVGLGLGYATVTLRVSPSTFTNAFKVAEALRSSGYMSVEIWRSGERVSR